MKNPFLTLLEQALPQMAEPRALDSIPFPPGKLREMLVLADEQEEHPSALNHYKLWQFITEAVPATRMKSCRLSPMTAGAYNIEIIGDHEEDKDLLFWHAIPDDRLYWFLEKMGHLSRKVEMYDLFQYLVTLEPRIADPEIELVYTAVYGNVGFGGKKKG